MKYLLFILPLVFFWLAGCNTQTAPHIISLPEAPKNNLTDVQNKIPINNFFTWELKQPFIYDDIIISWDMLIYNNIFTIKIPDSLSKREYENSSITVFQLLSQDSMYKGFMFSVWEQTYTSENQNDEDKCTYTYREFPQPRTSLITNKEDIKNKEIYITQTTYWEWKDHAQICFFYKNIMYKIWINNYNASYIDQIIDSFTFLD